MTSVVATELVKAANLNHRNNCDHWSIYLRNDWIIAEQTKNRCVWIVSVIQFHFNLNSRTAATATTTEIITDMKATGKCCTSHLSADLCRRKLIRNVWVCVQIHTTSISTWDGYSNANNFTIRNVRFESFKRINAHCDWKMEIQNEFGTKVHEVQTRGSASMRSNWVEH